MSIGRRLPIACAATAAFLMLLVPTSAQQPETLSLFGRPLGAKKPSGKDARQLDADLAAAQAAFDSNPDADATIWLGRRLAYAGRYTDAIAVYTRGLEQFPDDARLLRHRGHRLITIRKFDLAVRDLAKAADLVEGKPDSIEPDGQPNERNVPTSTLDSNIYYHLGLAHYLRAEFSDAADAYRKGMPYAKSPDMRVAMTHWLYMTLRRLNRPDDAAALLPAIAPGLDIIENGAYYQLLLFYKGQGTADALSKEKGVDGVTLRYALANRDYYSGDTDAAKAAWKKIVERDVSEWTAFGYIAAEADLFRAAPRIFIKPKKEKSDKGKAAKGHHGRR